MMSIIVSDNSLKKLPASPLMSLNGKCMTMVASDDATMAGNKSCTALLTAVKRSMPGRSSYSR